MANGNGKSLALPITLVLTLCVVVGSSAAAIVSVQATSKQELLQKISALREVSQLEHEKMNIKLIELQNSINVVAGKSKDHVTAEMLDRWTGTDHDHFAKLLKSMNKDLSLEVPERTK